MLFAWIVCNSNKLYYQFSGVIILLMFRREREFNIISGETCAFGSQRASANLEKVRRFESVGQLPPRKTERLGYSKDRRQYQYSYESLPKQPKLQAEDPSASSANPPASMLNSVSTAYNIVNMKAQHATSKVISADLFAQKLPEVNRKSPLTAHIQAGRLFASNYHADYPDRVARHEFSRRRGLCDAICENQKTYGMTYFRVMK